MLTEDAPAQLKLSSTASLTAILHLYFGMNFFPDFCPKFSPPSRSLIEPLIS